MSVRPVRTAWDPSAWALVAVLACLPLGWIPIAAFGGFDLTLPYAVTILLGATLLLKFGQATVALRDLIVAMAPWLIVYVMYLLVLSMSLAGLPNNGIVLRQGFFLICGMTVACTIATLGVNSKALRKGGAAAIIGFLVVTELYARQIGLSWITALERFFFSGDLSFVVYKFLREIFRTAQSGAGEAPASVKNAVAVGLFTALAIFRAGHDKPKADRLGQMVTCLTFLVLLLLNTRSVLLVVIIALPVALGIASIRRTQHSAHGLILKYLMFIAALAVMLIILSADTAAVSVFESRFSFDDNSAGGRLTQFEVAIAGIEQNILFGSGLIEINGLLVHNLFLGAWLHAGLIPFLLVTTFYLALLVTWFNFVLEITMNRDAWVLPLRAEWIAVLPLLPLFRVWISGDAGHPEFSSWIALFTFLTIVMVNKRERSFQRAPTPPNFAALV